MRFSIRKAPGLRAVGSPRHSIRGSSPVAIGPIRRSMWGAAPRVRLLSSLLAVGALVALGLPSTGLTRIKDSTASLPGELWAVEVTRPAAPHLTLAKLDEWKA